jgi:hypothetical protein
MVRMVRGHRAERADLSVWQPAAWHDDACDDRLLVDVQSAAPLVHHLHESDPPVQVAERDAPCSQSLLYVLPSRQHSVVPRGTPGHIKSGLAAPIRPPTCPHSDHIGQRSAV